MDERLTGLISEGAEVTIKLRKTHVFVQIKMRDKQSLKATGKTLDSAITKALASANSVDIKRARKDEERFRRNLIDKMGKYDDYDEGILSVY